MYMCISCVYVHLHVCKYMYMHAYISWLHSLKRYRSRDIPGANSTASAWIFISNTIPHQKEQGVLGEVTQSRAGEA